MRPIGADSPTPAAFCWGNAQTWIEDFFGRGANTSRCRINTLASSRCINNEPGHNRRSVMNRCDDGDMRGAMIAGHALNTRVGGGPRRHATGSE